MQKTINKNSNSSCKNYFSKIDFPSKNKKI